MEFSFFEAFSSSSCTVVATEGRLRRQQLAWTSIDQAARSYRKSLARYIPSVKVTVGGLLYVILREIRFFL